MRHRLKKFCIAICTTALASGCTVFAPVAMNPGEPEQTVLAKLGTPTGRYADGPDHLLEYARAPFGQQTYMARIGADGKLVSYEQVLTAQKFARIKAGQSGKDDVLRIIGGPRETEFLSLSQLEVWSYAYKESGVWDSLMHVHFDRAGVVQKMMNGPDPLFDPDMRFPLGRLRR
ncbi:MAG: hypothetical protein H7315_03895 [Herminiimonas sp.]|nr:hypothetical protein [Herminiimonas sp.]